MQSPNEGKSVIPNLTTLILLMNEHIEKCSKIWLDLFGCYFVNEDLIRNREVL